MSSTLRKTSKLLSPAKVNLCLRILDRRPDGYHTIFSLMQPVTLFDEISIEVSDGEGVYVACNFPGVPTDESNLAHKAATLLLEKSKVKCKVYINIAKSIPVAAGLGGGSSNAASVLMELNKLINAKIKEDDMLQMSSAIGSDVPFFLLGSPAVAKGRGDVLERISLPEYWYVLLNPGLEVSTAWAYNNLSLTKMGIDTNMLNFKSHNFRCVKQILKNDLEDVVITAHPVLNRLKALLLGLGAEGALMSGSGSTVFGLFSAEKMARYAYDALCQEALDNRWLLFLVRGVS